MLTFLNPKTVKEPERSLNLRLIILAAMLTPLAALGRVNANLWPHVLVAAVGIGIGHWYSYHNVDKNRRLVRGVMFVAIHLALLWMFAGLFRGYTVPQAQFAVFAQAITSFDLRYRRSLFNTLIHSLANLYIAASLSRDFELGLYLILFGIFMLAAFFPAKKESGLKQAKMKPAPASAGRATAGPAAPHRRSMTLFGLGFGAMVIAGVFLAFIFTPRFANNPIVPPFSLNAPLRGGVKSEIVNPGVPLVQINGWSDETGDYFFGFDSNLDLRYRGGLSDKIVMYVRSPSRSYWRSHSYDFYDGVVWSQSDKSLTEIKDGGVRFRLAKPLGSPVDRAAARQMKAASQPIVQTFTLVENQPNLIFSAYRPSEIFIVASEISIDSGDGLRLPEGLKAGMTYSVISERPDFDPDLLRQASTGYPPQIAARYLQLPDNISGRVKNLARRLTSSYDNPYDKILALNNHLLAEYPYNFFPPPHAPGAEVVDTFLFEDQEGFCEQYVTSLVVMARTLGVPARLATGYGAGDYNPITNYYEVRYSHAHSWAEVYFPKYGWVPFDPTPGWTPQPYPTPVQNWLFSNGSLLEINMSGVSVGEIVSQGAAGLLFFLPFLVGAALLVGLVMGIIFLVKRLNLRPAPSAGHQYTTLTDSPTRRLILKLYRQAVKLLINHRYRRREPGETLAEYARRMKELPALTRLTQVAEVAAYRPVAPETTLVKEAEQALASLREETKLGN